VLPATSDEWIGCYFEHNSIANRDGAWLARGPFEREANERGQRADNPSVHRDNEPGTIDLVKDAGR